MSDNNLYLFFIASLMLNLTPGNDMIYVISRSISQGAIAGLCSAVGIFIGCFVHITAAVLGLSALIMQSVFLFEFIKYAGALYLIYLGISALTSKSNAGLEFDKLPKVDKWTLVKQGILTNALNPKVAIFFLSFLPQFIDTSGNVKLQLFSLGLWFGVQGTAVLILMALLFGKTANLIKKYPKFWEIQEKLTGVILIGLGIKIALTSKK